jgi:hypothetical protein
MYGPLYRDTTLIVPSRFSLIVADGLALSQRTLPVFLFDSALE